MSRRPGRAQSEFRLRNAVRTSLATFAASAFLALAPRVVNAQAVEDSVAVRSQIDAYRTVWDTHDPSALAAFFTDDAYFVMGNLPAVKGRQAIADRWQNYFANQESERHLTLDVHSLRLVAADVAVVNVATTTGGRDREGQELHARRFRGTWVMHGRSGKWLISAMLGLPIEEDRVVLNTSLSATDALRPDIRAFVDAYEDAFNSHDPSAVSAFYRDDADIIVRNGTITHGRRAILDWWRSYFSEPRPYRAILIVEDIRTVSPDVALINIVATGAAAKVETQRERVRYARATWLVVREDDRWLITALRVLPGEDDRIIRAGGR